MADDPVAGGASQLDRVQRLAQGADLVRFDQNRVCALLVDAALDSLDVGHEDVVADQLDQVAETLGQHPPTCPLVLGEAVLDHHEREARDEVLVHLDHRLCVQLSPFPPSL